MSSLLDPMPTPSLRFVLVALLALSSSDLAAQSPPPAVMDVERPRSPHQLSLPRGGAEVLYDQTDNPSDESFPSQEFEASSTSINSQGGDDFTVPEDSMWSVSEVAVLGRYRLGTEMAEIVDVYFYADEAGSPGTRIAKYDSLSVDSDDEGDLTVTLSPSMIFTEGTYWVSFVADMDRGTEGRQWYWITQATTTAIGAEVHWRNPGDGFATGCRNWTPLSVCDDDSGGLDASFRLSGRASDSFVVLDPVVISDSLAFGESGTETVTISNDTDQPVAFSVADFTGGFVTDVTPAQDTIPAEGSVELVVTLDAAGLEPGMYTGEIEIVTDLGPDGTVLTLPVELTVAAPVAAEDGAGQAAFALRRNYPNPFATETTVELVLPEAGAVTVEVYDTLGRRVAELADGDWAAGSHRLRWDARGMASGVYVVRAQAGARSATLAVVLAR